MSVQNLESMTSHLSGCLDITYDFVYICIIFLHLCQSKKIVNLKFQLGAEPGEHGFTTIISYDYWLRYGLTASSVKQRTALSSFTFAARCSNLQPGVGVYL